MKLINSLNLVATIALLTSACGKNPDYSQQGSTKTASSNNTATIPSELLNTAVVTPPASNDKISAFIRELHRGVFEGTTYDHSSFDPTAVVDHYRKLYNPNAGLGCRRIAYVFLASHPSRAAALGANGNYNSAADQSLRTFILAHYKGILPNHPGGPGQPYNGPAHNVYSWYVNGYLTMDQLAAIFLDDPNFASRCRSAGLEI